MTLRAFGEEVYSTELNINNGEYIETFNQGDNSTYIIDISASEETIDNTINFSVPCGGASDVGSWNTEVRAEISAGYTGSSFSLFVEVGDSSGTLDQDSSDSNGVYADTGWINSPNDLYFQWGANNCSDVSLNYAKVTMRQTVQADLVYNGTTKS